EAEEVRQEMKRFNELREKIDEAFPFVRIGDFRLKSVPKGDDQELHLGIRASSDQLHEVGRIRLGKYPSFENFRVQSGAKFRIRLLWREWCAFAVFLECRQYSVCAIGEIDHDHLV